MVRSTTLYLAALSVSAVFATSAAPSTHQLARRHHNVRSKTSKAGSARGVKKNTRCTASSSGSSSTLPVTSGSSGSGDDDDDKHPGSSPSSGSSSGSGSGSSSGSGSTVSGPGKNSTTGTSSGDDGGDSDSGSSGGSSGSSTSHVLPAGSHVAGWTLVSELPSDVKGVQTFTFDDETFIHKNQLSALEHPVRDGIMKVHFNKGAYDLKVNPANIKGGFSFYTPGPGKSGSKTSPALDLSATKACTVSFGYSAKFDAGFQCNKGGKLPGLMGGTSWENAVKASGGNHPNEAWSTRMMFRPNCAGELYMYIPTGENRSNLCGKTGTSPCHGPSGNGKTYGASVGTGNFNWSPGSWTSIRQEIHLNTPGKKDGWAKVYVNGSTTAAITITDISFGPSGTKFWGQQMQSFFGGHETDWASPQAQTIQFKDFSVVVTDTC